MANGQFLKDVSSGIFNRLRELDREQQVKDEKSKLQTIELLSGLAGQVEPDSLPLLMSQIGQTIGVKGKLKGFWDAFSGMPNRSMEDQLGTIMNQATSSLVGPQEAKQARQTYKGELLQPFRDAGTRPRSAEALPYKTPPTLADRLILRDPRQEKLEELDARYGAQLENQRVMQNERYQDALGRAKYSSDLKLQELNAKNQADSMKAINALSNQLLAGDKTLTPQMAVEKAGDILGSTAEAKLSALRALEPLRAAQTVQAQTMAGSMKKTGGLTPYQDISVEDRRREAAGKVKGSFDDAMRIMAESKKKMADIAAGLNEKLSRGKSKSTFDPATGSIKAAPGELGPDILFKKELEEYRDAAAKLAGAETQAKGDWGKLRMDPYKKYFKVGATFKDPVEEILTQEKKIVSPPRAKGSTGRALRPGERVGMGATRMGAYTLKEVSNPEKYPVGSTVRDPNTGKRFTIEKKVNNTLYLIPIQ